VPLLVSICPSKNQKGGKETYERKKGREKRRGWSKFCLGLLFNNSTRLQPLEADERGGIIWKGEGGGKKRSRAPTKVELLFPTLILKGKGDIYEKKKKGGKRGGNNRHGRHIAPPWGEKRKKKKKKLGGKKRGEKFLAGLTFFPTPAIEERGEGGVLRKKRGERKWLAPFWGSNMPGIGKGKKKKSEGGRKEKKKIWVD